LEAQSASSHQISFKLDDFQLRYSDKTIFQMAAIRHLEFSKFGILNDLTSASEVVFKLCWLKQSSHPSSIVCYFACRRKVVHLCFIMSPGKMIFAVLEL